MDPPFHRRPASGLPGICWWLLWKNDWRLAEKMKIQVCRVASAEMETKLEKKKRYALICSRKSWDKIAQHRYFNVQCNFMAWSIKCFTKLYNNSNCYCCLRFAKPIPGDSRNLQRLKKSQKVSSAGVGNPNHYHDNHYRFLKQSFALKPLIKLLQYNLF